LLLALAEGGFQVGELAKRYHPGGHDITSLDYEDAELETNRLLKQHNVILFEPAIRFKNLFIRVDVLIKRGTDLELIEVKAKSYDRFDKESFFNKNGSLASSWRSYLYDVAFQDYVLKLALPNYTKKADIGVKPRKTPGLSTSERQWLQVQKVKDRDSAPWIDSKGLQSEMDAWNFPLHFIDFETTMVAIPFNKGRYPYEGIAFQFSHHTIQESGIIAHEGEYLCTLRGAFPNYDFIRALKTQLEKDDGTVFRYSAHENTFLCLIHAQLRTDSSPPQDRDELMAFIRSITRSGRKNKDTWVGKRCMVDMLELVKRYYYLPETNGSNSLKYILPATLNASPALQKKYSHPVYGAEGGIRSYNFSDWRWIQTKNGQIIDPYKLLPPVFSDAEGKTQELISENPELRDGGAAMIAYARAQYEEMSNFERERIFQALRKYCELDTLAMVMLYEGWQDLLQMWGEQLDEMFLITQLNGGSCDG
jgi:hypothetical protein